MKLQRASRFAIYALLELAADPDRQRSAAEIGAKFHISTHHLAKVLQTLGRAGLVESVRGAGGGYRFAGNAKRTTLADVIDLFESTTANPEGASEPGLETETGRALGQVLTEIDEIAQATLRSITLSTMLKLIARRRRRHAA